MIFSNLLLLIATLFPRHIPPFSWNTCIPLIISPFILVLFRPNASGNIKKAKFEMMKFGEYKCLKCQMSFIQND